MVKKYKNIKRTFGKKPIKVNFRPFTEKDREKALALGDLIIEMFDKAKADVELALYSLESVYKTYFLKASMTDAQFRSLLKKLHKQRDDLGRTLN